MSTGAGDYVREIEARFLELEGRGFALSAQDVGRVLLWHREGVPLRTVLTALEEADRRRRAELSSERLTLGRLARTIEAAMRRRGERVAAPAATVAPPVQGDWGRLQAALAAATGPAADLARAMLEAAQAAGTDVWQAAEEIDRAALDALLVAATPAELASYEARLPRSEAQASPEVREERRRLLLGRALRERWGLPELVGVLLGGGP